MPQDQEGLAIPCVDQVPNRNYMDGTILYDKENNCFKFRQNGEWAVLALSHDGGGYGGGGSGGSGGTPSDLPGFGAGILALNDDGDGLGRRYWSSTRRTRRTILVVKSTLANTASQPVALFDRAGKFYLTKAAYGTHHLSVQMLSHSRLQTPS